jgi:hypothetical protein
MQPLEESRWPRRRSIPWSRVLLTLAVAGPALWIGGVPPVVVPVFSAVMLALWLRLDRRANGPLRIPWVAGVLGLAAGVTLLQWLPIPGMRAVLAPELHAMVTDALQGTDAEAWPGLTIVPGDTALECARLIGLMFLVIAAAQFTWQTIAGVIAATGVFGALTGLAHTALGAGSIYGLYSPQYKDLSTAGTLIGTFVNENHQAGLLLLGIFCAGALAIDQDAQGQTSRDAGQADRHHDRFLAAMAALVLQLAALVLTLSRGALLAIIMIGPIALWLGVKRVRSGKRHRARKHGPSAARLLMGAGLVLLFLMMAQHDAWRELSTLLVMFEPGGELDTKVRLAGESLALIERSPVVGTGRGSFIDLFPSIDSAPTHALFTHIETAPVTAIVEWGPVMGTLLMVGIGLGWWAGMRRARGKTDVTPRRIALLGVLALAIQSLGDFSLEFLGVTAPACALLGALSPSSPVRETLKRARWAGSLLVAALALSWWAMTATWSHRDHGNRALLGGKVDARVLLQERPLDGRLHTLVARMAAEDQRWPVAYEHAVTATALHPGAIDAWLLRSKAEKTMGRDAAARRSLTEGLERLHRTPSEDLVAWLVRQYPEPKTMAALAPAAPGPWKRLVHALAKPAPAHADALAAARERTHPLDPMPLEFRSNLAVRTKQPALALHHARLMRQVAPNDPAAYLVLAQALRSFSPPRNAEARDALEEALARPSIDDPIELGRLEQALIGVLLQLGDDASIQRAQQLLPTLLSRPASAAVRRGRAALAIRVEQGLR